MSGRDRGYMRKHGRNIMQLLHAELVHDTIMKSNGSGATFKEFIQYLKFPESEDPHWAPVYSICQPCAIKYDQIVKTETMDEDNTEIIMNHLAPYRRGLGTAGNVVAGSRQMSTLTQQGRKLEAYSSLNITAIEYIRQRFKDDLEQFGYGFSIMHDRNNFTLTSSCAQGYGGATCC